MPKTYTSDAAAALPSAIQGSFTIVNPLDLNSYFKLDPQTARIEAAGSARPVRRVNLFVARTIGFVSTVQLGTSLDARSIGAANDGGFYTLPFPIPPDMDVTMPSIVAVFAAEAIDGGGSTVARLELVTTHAKDGDTSMANATVTYDWTTPVGWGADDLKRVTIDSGGGATYAANYFEAGDLVGLRIQRMGAAAQDTFPNSLILAAGAILEYTAKQL